MSRIRKGHGVATIWLFCVGAFFGCSSDFLYPEPHLEADATEGVAPLTVTFTNVTPDFTVEPEHPIYSYFELRLPEDRVVKEFVRGEHIVFSFQVPGEYEITLAVAYFVVPDVVHFQADRRTRKSTSIPVTVYP